MEIDVTALITNDFNPIYYSASIAELGSDAGSITWENAFDLFDSDELEDFDSKHLIHIYNVVDQNHVEVRDYYRAFGAWDDETIDGWSVQELCALLVQFVAGDYRQMTRDDYDPDAEGGSLYQGNDGSWYYLM